MIAMPMTVERRNDPVASQPELSHRSMPQPGEPHVIANVALLLASDQASSVSGSSYVADDGMLQGIGGA
jgi:glucose 1-dehydrogenase